MRRALFILTINLSIIAFLRGQEIIDGAESPVELVNRLCLPQDPRESTGGVQADIIREMRIRRTVFRLVRLGTNSWPAVPALAAAMSYPDPGVRTAVAEVLAGHKADRCPGWANLEKNFNGQTNAFYAFRWLALSGDRLSEHIDVARRRAGLLGLAAVGPIAQGIGPDLKSIGRSKREHELWSAAIVALRGIGCDASELGPGLKQTLINPEEHPSIRASAARALALLSPEDPQTRTLLQQMLNDGSSHVRIAAAQALWSLHEPADKVLPTLSALLRHKLASVRLGALQGLLEMGVAAAPANPIVLELDEDGNEAVRQAATAVLQKTVHSQSQR